MAMRRSVGAPHLIMGLDSFRDGDVLIDQTLLVPLQVQVLL
jgi:hypothetical protein